MNLAGFVIGIERGFQKEQFAVGSSLDALLHYLKHNINDPAQFLGAQRFEDYDFVQTVDEFRRELSTGGRDAGARDPGAEFRIATGVLQRGNVEAQPWTQYRAHFGCA